MKLASGELTPIETNVNSSRNLPSPPLPHCQVVPFSEAPKVFKMMSKGLHQGKMVLKVDQQTVLYFLLTQLSLSSHYLSHPSRFRLLSPPLSTFWKIRFAISSLTLIFTHFSSLFCSYPSPCRTFDLPTLCSPLTPRTSSLAPHEVHSYHPLPFASSSPGVGLELASWAVEFGARSIILSGTSTTLRDSSKKLIESLEKVLFSSLLSLVHF